VRDSGCGFIGDSEVDLEAVDQVEESLASVVKPSRRAVKFRHVRFAQVQTFGGFCEAVESRWFDY